MTDNVIKWPVEVSWKKMLRESKSLHKKSQKLIEDHEAMREDLTNVSHLYFGEPLNEN